MKTDFCPETHLGRVDGVLWPSTTQLIKEFKLVDYSSVPDDRLEYKRVLGMAVDRACELWDNDNLDETSLHKDILPYFNAYKKWREISGFEISKERSMKRLWSQKWRYHGAPDLVGTLNGKLVLIDRKCTWVLYASGGTQTAAYKLLHDENYNEKIKERYLLKLNPNGNYDDHLCAQTSDLMDFQACLVLHWRRREKYRTMTEKQLIELYKEK